MPRKKPSRPKTSKTEFMRFLDERAIDVPGTERFIPKYHQHKAASHFGHWMRTTHALHFNKLYRTFWLRNPGLFGVIYEGVGEDCAES